jgi:hypothetical protein
LLSKLLKLIPVESSQEIFPVTGAPRTPAEEDYGPRVCLRRRSIGAPARPKDRSSIKDNIQLLNRLTSIALSLTIQPLTAFRSLH